MTATISTFETLPLSDVLFLNYKGEPISERGIRKLVVKYRKNAGITKRASCHTLRHTFATYKVEKGVSPFQLQQWLGHANLNTTQIYVHLGKQNVKKIMEQTSSLNLSQFVEDQNGPSI
jgi:site-specific recombinase XerD